LIEDGVVPFHQPPAGRVVSTVNVPDLAGLREMLPFLPVTLQSPKPPEAEDDDEEEELEPQAANDSVIASAAARASGRLRCMTSLFFWRREVRTTGA
jgi:hypothetical protein